MILRIRLAKITQAFLVVTWLLDLGSTSAIVKSISVPLFRSVRIKIKGLLVQLFFLKLCCLSHVQAIASLLRNLWLAESFIRLHLLTNFFLKAYVCLRLLNLFFMFLSNKDLLNNLLGVFVFVQLRDQLLIFELHLERLRIQVVRLLSILNELVLVFLQERVVGPHSLELLF